MLKDFFGIASGDETNGQVLLFDDTSYNVMLANAEGYQYAISFFCSKPNHKL